MPRHGTPTTLFLVLTFLPTLMVAAILAFRRLSPRLTTRSPPSSPVRGASLRPEQGSNPHWWLGLLPNLLLITGTAALLTARWPTIPARIPIHWNLEGQPNSWASRTPASIFGLLLLNLAFLAVMLVFGEITVRSSPGFPGRALILRTIKRTLLAASWFVTLVCCGIALLPLRTHLAASVPALAIGTGIGALALVSYALAQSARNASALQAGRESTDPHFWRSGLFYYNPADSALMVPKQNGLGYTLNFGRPLAWIIMAAILTLPVVLPILWATHKQ